MMCKYVSLYGYLGYPSPNPQPSYLAPSPQPQKIFNQLDFLLVKLQSCDLQIMWTLLSMVCRLIKPCRLAHVTCTCFKETAILFNVHFSCFVDFILCPTDKYIFKINNKIHLHVFKVKIKYIMTLFWCFYC